MTSRDFCYWLQGFFEIYGSLPTNLGNLDAVQVAVIRRHLGMVFVHEIDPSFPKDQQQQLDKAHVGVTGYPPFDANVKYRC